MPKNLEATTTNNTDSEYYSTVVTDTNYSSEYAKPTIKERFNNFLYDFERSQWYEFFYLKVVGGALLGATIAYLYITCVLYKTFSDHDSPLYWLTFVTVLFLSTTSCMISMRARCIALLCFPTLFGGVGRRIYKAMLLAWVLAGPVENLIAHVKESIASMTCMANMHAGQLKKIFYLIYAPITGGYIKASSDVSHQDREYNILKEKFLEMMQFILDESTSNDEKVDVYKENREKLASIKVGTEMKKKTQKECERIFRKANKACIKYFNDVIQTCKDKLPYILEWTCEAVQLGKVACLATDWIGDGICSSWPLDNARIDREWHDMVSIQGQVEMETENPERNWAVNEPDEKELLRTVEELNRRITIFSSYMFEIFQVLLSCAEKLMALLLIYIIVAALRYLQNWEKNLDFDNYYITPYFVRKDTERRLEGKRNLLPFKRVEKMELATTFEFKMTFTEKKAMLVKVVSYTIEAFVVSLLFVADIVIYRVFLELSRHAEVKTEISGEHKLDVRVEGEGRVAKMLNNSFAPFQNNYFVLNITENNAGCLPVARQISNEVIARVATGYTVLYASLFFEVYILRLRHVIAAFVYRKHEKQRIIYLYSQLSRKRKNGLKESKRQIEKLAVDYYLEQKYSYGLHLREKYENNKCLTKLFDFFKVANHKCIICDEGNSEELPLVFCQPTNNNFGCNLPYCAVCWTELQGKCWACQYDKNDTELTGAYTENNAETTQG